MELFTRLTEIFKDYETKIEPYDGMDRFLIINPFSDEHIRVSDDDGIIFYFSTQHAHFDYYSDIDENIESLVDYINDFLSGKRVAIEFFCGDTDICGGDRYIDDIDFSSGESLLNSFTGGNLRSLHKTLYRKLKGQNCHCSIRSWNNALNKDIDFVL